MGDLGAEARLQFLEFTFFEFFQFACLDLRESAHRGLGRCGRLYG
jgi:hypothetical protein